MSVIPLLACSLGRRDELPNQELARRIVKKNDQAGIRELVVNLWNKMDAAIPSDCIKVLVEIGYLEPGLIAGYADDFLRLLKSRNNRLVWGAMQAAVLKGSVITRDNGVSALAGIASTGQARRQRILPFLLEHLRTCRPKDVPQHSEKILPAVDSAGRDEFIAVLEVRLEDLQGAQVKRVEKVIRQAQTLQ